MVPRRGLGEFSKVSFDQLAMDENGNKLNRLTFEQGYATFHLLPEHHDAYAVKVADATLTPNGKSEFRADLDHSRARVEVFAGSVDLAQDRQAGKTGQRQSSGIQPRLDRSRHEPEAGNRQGFLGQVDKRARHAIATRACGPGRPRPQAQCMAGAIWMLTANGDFSRASVMGGLPSPRWAGLHTAWGCGVGTRAWDIRGLAVSPGVGCLTTTGFGITPLASVIFGCRANLTPPSPRRWSVGIRDRDGLAGPHWACWAVQDKAS